MTLNQLKYFLTLADKLNYTRAAESLFMTQPNLSKQISAFEAELGFSLFIRNSRNVVLTDQGELLKERLTDHVASIDAAIAEAKSLGGMPRITLGMLYGQDLGENLTESLQSFRLEHPELEIDVIQCGHKALRTGLMDGRFDAIITQLFELRGYANLITRPVLAPGWLGYYMHKSNPWAKHSGYSLVDLKNETFLIISHTESPQGYYGFIDHCYKSGTESPKIIEEPSQEKLLLDIELGLGIGVMDSTIKLINSPVIHFEPIVQAAYPMVVVAIKKSNRKPHLMSFIEALQLDEYTDENGEYNPVRSDPPIAPNQLIATPDYRNT